MFFGRFYFSACPPFKAKSRDPSERVQYMPFSPPLWSCRFTSEGEVGRSPSINRFSFLDWLLSLRACLPFKRTPFQPLSSPLLLSIARLLRDPVPRKRPFFVESYAAPLAAELFSSFAVLPPSPPSTLLDRSLPGCLVNLVITES